MRTDPDGRDEPAEVYAISCGLRKQHDTSLHSPVQDLAEEEGALQLDPLVVKAGVGEIAEVSSRRIRTRWLQLRERRDAQLAGITDLCRQSVVRAVFGPRGGVVRCSWRFRGA